MDDSLPYRRRHPKPAATVYDDGNMWHANVEIHGAEMMHEKSLAFLLTRVDKVHPKPLIWELHCPDVHLYELSQVQLIGTTREVD